MGLFIQSLGSLQNFPKLPKLLQIAAEQLSLCVRTLAPDSARFPPKPLKSLQKP